MMEGKALTFGRDELNKWLNSPVTKALMDDITERRAFWISELATNPISTQESVAYANKLQGMIENADFIFVFPTLLLADIQDEENNKQSKKEKES
jgi:hypothetical protein